MGLVPFLVFLILAYLVGSIPFAYILVRRLKGVDIRTVGSGNVGATNASRVLGKPMGALALLLDLLKGVVAAWLLRLILQLLAEWWNPVSPTSQLLFWLKPDGTALCLGLAAFLGHCYSPFLLFRGGKGVATALGVYLVVAPIAALLTAAVCAVIIVVTRLVSLASITGAILLPISMAVFDTLDKSWDPSIHNRLFVYTVTIVLSALVIFRHRSNIKRLLARKENKT